MPTVAEFLRPRLPFPRISDAKDVQDFYNQSRLAGSSHKLAEMLSLRQFPGVFTDTRWIAGHERSFDRRGQYEDAARRQAREAGVTTEGAVYKHQLARYPGDPKAWVTSRADCVRIAEERGLTLEGSINYKPPDRDEDECAQRPYRVADDLLEENFKKLQQEAPHEAARPEAKEALAERLSGE